MQAPYQIEDAGQIFSPQLVVFRELVERNIAHMLDIAADPSRLRPHCKTHKMPAVTRLQMERGIDKFKCATFAEAEMLADAGVRHALLAYNMVGPNICRAVQFVERFPQVSFAVTADDATMIRRLSEAVKSTPRSIGVLLDIDPGRHRTGVPVGREARQLYELIARSPGLRPEGLHVYDGHLRQSDFHERCRGVAIEWGKLVAFHDELEEAGLPVPRMVCGGTPTFPCYARLDHPSLELSPGTCLFHDAGYAEMFAEQTGFTPAALVLTRVVSRPMPNRVTFDVGTKAIAADPPAGQRMIFPEIPDAVQVLHNEEHLVVETAQADRWSPGDSTLVIPRHVCPTSALYKEAYVVAGRRVVDRWPVVARDRQLHV